MNLKKLRQTIILILLYHIAFIRISYITNYDYIKYTCIIFIGLFIIKNHHFLKNQGILSVNIILNSYLFVVLLSAFLNRNTTQIRNPFLSAIVYASIILEIFLVLRILASKHQFKQIIDVFYYLSLFYAIVTDITFLLFRGLYIQYAGLYLIGNKFDVSYLHLQLLVLLIQKCRMEGRSVIYKNTIMLVYILLSLWVTTYVQCATGTVGLLLLLLLNFIPEHFLCNPIIALSALVISSISFFAFANILTNKYVEYFIINILHKDITLSTRMIIYRHVGRVIEGHWLMGYGYGSGYEICMNLIHAPNLQNGLIDCIMQQGIIAAILLIILYTTVFRNLNHKFLANKEYIPSAIMVYIYVLISCVEITFNTSFLFWILITYAGCLNNKYKKLGGFESTIVNNR